MTYGRDDLMAVCAVRYCLGRRTYIVGYCADWLAETWPALSDPAKRLIQVDVEDAFARDDEDRERDGPPHIFALGHDCDRAEWERARALWRQS